jgi:hypothetical protein
LRGNGNAKNWVKSNWKCCGVGFSKKKIPAENFSKFFSEENFNFAQHFLREIIFCGILRAKKCAKNRLQAQRGLAASCPLGTICKGGEIESGRQIGSF